MKLHFALASIALLATLVSPAMSGPSMSVNWKETRLAMEPCKIRAVETLSEGGFSGLKILDFAVYAERADYSAMLRCAPSLGIMVVFVAGPDIEPCNAYMNDLRNRF
jgi:hypothetical protein